jgi:protein-disulfide isomerase
MDKKIIGACGAAFVMGAAACLVVVGLWKKTSPVAAGQRAECFSGGNQSALFALDGKVFTLDALPPDLHQPFLLAQIDSFRRVGDVINLAAARAAVGKGGNIPTLREIFGDNWVKDEEVELYYHSNSNIFSKEIPLAQLRSTIRSHLEQMKTNAFVSEQLAKMNTEKRFTELLSVPCGPKKSLNISGISFTVGDSHGPEELVFFSDFMSPQARYAVYSVNRFAAENKEKITVKEVFIPPERNGISEEMIRAAYCVADQDKKFFESFRSAAYQVSTLLNSRTDPQGNAQSRAKVILSVAKNVGVNAEEFQKCVLSDEAKNFVDKSITAAQEAGVLAVPAFFIHERQMVLPGVSDPGKIVTEVASALGMVR